MLALVNLENHIVRIRIGRFIPEIKPERLSAARIGLTKKV